MDFGLSDDQQLLQKTVGDYLAEEVAIERVRKLRERSCPNDRDVWRGLAELGLAGVLVAEQHGGSGLALLDAALVSEALGYAATPSPFLTTAIMAATALEELEATDTLVGLASGDTMVGVATTEVFSVREEAGVRLEGRRLVGKSMMALDACGADLILVCLDSATMALVRGDAEGLTRTRLITTDATRCTSELLFESVATEAVFSDAAVPIERMLRAGRIGLAADVLGACQSMIDQSVAYAQERKQFDRLIGSFQAVKHMCAEMISDLEPARSLLWYAAHGFDALPDEAPMLACHALAHLSEIGREIASVSTQVHGGIGWTDEQNLHFWFKRIGNARHLLGGPEALRDEAARLQGFAPAA